MPTKTATYSETIEVPDSIEGTVLDNGTVQKVGIFATAWQATRSFGRKVASFTHLDQAWAWGSGQIKAGWVKSASWRAWIMANAGPGLILALGTEFGQKVVVTGLSWIQKGLNFLCKPIMWILDRIGRRDPESVKAGLPATRASIAFTNFVIKADKMYTDYIVDGAKQVFEKINDKGLVISTARHSIVAGAAYLLFTAAAGPLALFFAAVSGLSAIRAVEGPISALSKKYKVEDDATPAAPVPAAA